jgi:hypothetical protein
MKPTKHIPEPPPEVFDFIESLKLTPEQDHALIDAMVIYHYRIGWSGHPLRQPMHVLLSRMVEVGISVAPCVREYLEKVEKARNEA